MTKKSYSKMIICGGGINGIAIIGAISEFSKLYDLDKIKDIIGISIGSVIGLLIIIGYSIDEIINIFIDINMEKFSDIKVSRLLTDYGLDNGILGTKLLKALLANKSIDINITFEKLNKDFNKNLIICGTNITLGKAEYFNFKNNPNMKVLDAIKISTSFPFIYTPVKYNENLYIDGGLLSPYPIDYFDNKNELIGFLIHRETELISVYDTSSIEKYYGSLLNIVLDSYLEKFYKGHENITVLLNKNELTNNSMDFSISKKEKNYLLTKGKDFFKKFYEKYLKETITKDKKIKDEKN